VNNMKYSFKLNIISIYGSVGKQWLKALPEIISKITKEYNLANLKPVNNLSYNYVLTGFQGSKAIILKLGLDIDGFKREASALMAFEGSGVVPVFSENHDNILQNSNDWVVIDPKGVIGDSAYEVAVNRWF